jgi:Holliday junction resolvase
VNGREKGKRGERAWRDELRANGYDARRGQQFSGSPDSPDVICDALAFLHFEVKCVERLNIEDAMEQARHDAAARFPIVAHKRNHRRWLVTMDAETFFRFLRGDFSNAEKLKTETLRSEDVLRGATSPTNTISAAACAAATNQNNKQEPGRGPTNTNETESQ